MVEDLQFALEPLPHAYPNQPGAELELWGRLSVLVTGAAGTRVLTETEWDLSEFASWFVENQRWLCSDQLATDSGTCLVLPNESLAKALLRLQQVDFEDDEAEVSWFDFLFKYRSRHVLTFALRGGRVAPLVIGCNGSAGEISNLDDTSVCHRFSMRKFLNGLQKQVMALLVEWHGQTGMEARTKAQTLLTKLSEPHRICCDRTD